MATYVADAVVDELIRAGVGEAVLAPGSRSAPVALALHRADRAGRLRLHVRVDERSAGFLALGMAKVSGRAVAVVTTSGTAVANLHPAILEAQHAGVPLVALTADRPAELRGSGANQTTDQVRIFGPAVRWFADLSPDVGNAAARSVVSRAAAAALGRPAGDPGPVHLNVQFREPLLADPAADDHGRTWSGRSDERPWTVVDEAARPVPTVVGAGPRTVVVAGDGSGPAARQLAEQAGWPLFAEPTSGARTGEEAIRTYRLLLEHGPLAARIERVVVYGHPTLSRPVNTLLSRDDVEVVVVSGRGDWPDASLRGSRVVGAATVEHADDPSWAAAWRDADRDLSKAVDDLLAAEPGLTPHEVAAAVSAAVPPAGLLVVGSSNPIRDLDLVASAYPVGEHRKIVANRGLAGIDGTISTAVGAALARPSSRAFALLGDLTFLHDSNGLVLGPDEPRPALTIVVVNDDGGGIFTTLEQGAPRYADSFERVFGTPHHVDLAALCAATGTAHRLVDDLDELREALTAEPAGIGVVEVRVDRGDRRDLDQRLRGLAVR